MLHCFLLFKATHLWMRICVFIILAYYANIIRYLSPIWLFGPAAVVLVTAG